MRKEEVVTLMRQSGLDEFLTERGITPSNALTEGIYDVLTKGVIPNIFRAAQSGDGDTNAFGLKFKAKTRSERTGVNPQTGEQIVIPEMKTYSISVSDRLKNELRSEN